MNNMVDALAIDAHFSLETVGSTPLGYGILLYLNREPITGKYGKAIHHAATTPDIQNYYAEKHGWTDSILQSVDWDAFDHAQGQFTTLQQKNIHKYVHNWLPTGKVHDRRYNTTTQCIHCSLPDRRDHMRQCKHTLPHLASFYTFLETKLKKWHTEPGLARLWIDTLKGNFNEYTSIETNRDWIQTLRQEQEAPGHTQLWTGFLTQTWGDIQDAYHHREKHDQAYTGRR